MKRSSLAFTDDDYAAAYEYQRKLVQIAGDGASWDEIAALAATVVDASFNGMSRVQQQRAVYAALKGKMDGSDGELHALQLTTRARD